MSPLQPVDAVDFGPAGMKPKPLQTRWSDEDLEERNVKNVVKVSWEEEELAVKDVKEEAEADVCDSWE